MKLRTQHFISAGISVFLMLLIAGVVYNGAQRANAAIARSTVAAEIVIALSDLRSVALEYIVYQHERPRQQWQRRLDSVTDLLDSATFEGTSQQAIVTALRAKHKDLKVVFAALTLIDAAGENGGKGAATPLSRDTETRLAHQLLTVSHEMVGATFRLLHESDLEVANVQRRVNLLLLLAAVALGVVIVANVILENRYVLRPIRQLHRGAQLIGAGDLDHRTAVASSNEIGALSHALDRMTAQLQESRAALEAEHQRMGKDAGIRESEARYRGIVESVNEGIVSVDERQRIVLFNPGAERIFGRAAAETIGEPLGILVPERFRARHDLHVRGFSETGQTNRAMGQYGLIYGLRASGEEFPVEATIAQSGTSPDKLMTVILRDVTERMRAEAEKRETLAMLDATRDGAFIFDADSLRFTYVNEGAVKQLGYPREELLAMTPLDIKPEFDEKRFREMIAPLRRGEVPVLAFRTLHRRKDGHDLPVDINLQYIAPSQEHPRFIAIVRDITERIRAEKAAREYAERLRQLSRRLVDTEENERRRLARELHDRVGQNVTTLNLNLSMLRGELPADAIATVKPRLDDCESLLFSTGQLVRDLMGDLRPPGLEELGLLAALQEHARHVAKRTGLSLTVRGTELMPRLPQAAEIALFRVAQEALINIVKHARATEVVLSLEANSNLATLTVADNGQGFDCESALPAGHLGIVGMRERAEAIGGSLRVESAPGAGTRVIVEAPRAVTDDE